MKKLLSIILLFVFGMTIHANAQLFGNEWIVQTQPYFKFKVAQNGMYQIPIAALTSVGLPANTLGTSLQIFRDGVEIPIFVSNNGVLVTTDFIEFYGEKANGNLDRRLYADTNLQMNQSQNLVSDTAFYFVTIKNSTTNKRIVSKANTLTNLPTKENYIWRTELVNYRTDLARGESSIEGQYQNPELYTLNSSQFEQEGYVKKFSTTKDSVSIIAINPYTLAATPAAKLKTTVVGKSFLATHNIKVLIGTSQLADANYSKFNFTKINVPVAMSLMNTVNNEFKFYYQPSGAGNDRFGVATAELQYPSTFDFNNATSLYFELEPKASNYYLEITNFNKGNQKPKLYDVTSNEFLIGDTSIAGKIRFLISSSTTTKKLIIQNTLSINYKSVVGIESVVFKNFKNVANQGNYLIIADKRYADDGTGHDYVNDYKNYRTSTAGGSYVANVATLQDIYNEFGYGYDFSTLAIKNYLQFAYTSPLWSNKPNHVLIIGKGLEYSNYLAYKSANPISYPFYATPTFGQPGSDWLFTDFAKTSKPQIPIGRVSAFNSIDIKNYLQKVKEYEIAQNTNTQTSDEKLWQKRVLHIGGISDSLQSLSVRSALEREQLIIESPSFGGQATVLNKSDNVDIEANNNKIIDSFYNNGSRIVYFFGHSSATTIDYGLDFPERYTNYKKYPMMIANGCGAGNIFIYTGQKYLSERYVNLKDAGAIGFIACVNTGFSGNLGLYTDSLYGEIATTSYGKTIGEQMKKNINNLMVNPFIGTDLLFKMHTEQILLNGDPAIKLSTAIRPDYAIEQKNIILNPTEISTISDSVSLSVTINNLAKYTTDSIIIEIKRTLPDGNVTTLYSKKIMGFANTNTITMNVPTLGNLGAGINHIIATVDKLNAVAEIAENNNSASKTFTIANRGAVPVYPFEYSIVGIQGVQLKATTLNMFESNLPYNIQIDTTEKFNSSIMQSTIINSVGGVLRWQPTIVYKDSVVYYWRVAVNEPNAIWNKSSFIFINNSIAGWNQSHYYQFQDDGFSALKLDSVDRTFKFTKSKNLLQVQNVCLNAPTPFNYIWSDYFVKINGSTKYNFGCDPYPGYSSLQFVVIDSLTGIPWTNQRPNDTIAVGKFGSYDPCRVSVAGKYTDPFFEFNFLTPAARKNIMDFIDAIPSGNYIMIQPRLCVGGGCGGINNSFVKNWKADTTTLGSNNSLYHKLKNMGFNQIDSFYKNRSMILWTRKNIPSSVKQVIGKDSTDKLFGEFEFENLISKAELTSTIIGPAQNWTDFKRSLLANETTPGDKTFFEIYGITQNGKESLITNVVNDTSLAFINATMFPYLKLKMITQDLVTRTPEQLKYWRIYYTPVPEGAINPAQMYSVVNGPTTGTKLIKVAFENLTNVPMDSLLVTFTIFDRKDNVFFTESKRVANLAALDTIQIEYLLNTTNLFSNMEFQIEVNPINDQMEQFHGNNFALRSIALIDPSVPLPVTLNNFIVVDNKCDANLYWTTSDEINLSRYEIERKDKNDFQKIAIIYPTTPNNNVFEYNFSDKNLQPIQYTYRLKMIDLDEKYKYSNQNSIAINCATSTNIILYPNPTTDNSSLIIQSDETKEITIKVIDQLGKIVLEKTHNLKKGNNIVPIQTASLANGIYSIIVIDSNQKHVLKLNKQ